MKIAFIDFGFKRIGIAISDEGKKIAFPFKTVEGGKFAVGNTAAALKDQKIEKILVGLPLLLSGEKGAMAIEVEKFAKELGQAVSVPIEFIDERLSSKMADREMIALKMKRKKRAEKLDIATASILLQSYLDKINYGQ